MFVDVFYSRSSHAAICFDTAPQKIPSQWSSLIYAHMWGRPYMMFFKTKVAYTCDISGWRNASNQLTAAQSCVMLCMHDACARATMCMTCRVPEYPCMRIMVQGAMAEMCGHVRAVIPDSFCYNGTHVLHVYIFSTMPLYHFLLQATTLCHACMLGACMHHHVLMQICAPGMVP